MSRDAVLFRVRAALGRSVGQPVSAPPALDLPPVSVESPVDCFLKRFEALNGKGRRVGSCAEAGAAVESIVAGRTTVAAHSPLLEGCGVQFTNPSDWRQACAEADIGITSASYALADTGSLVMLAGPGEPRLSSLLPPIHIAVIPIAAILASLDELFSRVLEPAKLTSSLVLITGPSRTADIEQTLVRGVHGPGEIHVIVVG